MYPYYTGYVEGMELHSDDIAAIQYLYGNVLEFVCLFVCFSPLAHVHIFYHYLHALRQLLYY